MKITELVFIDVETTGQNDPGLHLDPVIEVAAARVRLADRMILDSYESLVLPWGPQAVYHDPEGDCVTWKLGKFHTEGGHFSDVTPEQWSTAPAYVDVLHVLRTRFLTDGATLAGANPGFDRSQLEGDFERCCFPWPKLDYHLVDIGPMAFPLYVIGEIEGLSVRNLLPWAKGPAYKQSHRAGGDVRDEIMIFWDLIDRFVDLPVVPARHPDPGLWKGRHP